MRTKVSTTFLQLQLQKLNTYARRTTAEQEVLSLIAPLGKLGRFEEAADFFSS